MNICIAHCYILLRGGVSRAIAVFIPTILHDRVYAIRLSTTPHVFAIDHMLRTQPFCTRSMLHVSIYVCLVIVPYRQMELLIEPATGWFTIVAATQESNRFRVPWQPVSTAFLPALSCSCTSRTISQRPSHNLALNVLIHACR
eukprot:m.120118 g.120118  ORF g.120118 m.120118 type:complete len:143 (-) comp13683_c0_seq25:999-1427(-)